MTDDGRDSTLQYKITSSLYSTIKFVFKFESTMFGKLASLTFNLISLASNASPFFVEELQ